MAGIRKGTRKKNSPDYESVKYVDKNGVERTKYVKKINSANLKAAVSAFKSASAYSNYANDVGDEYEKVTELLNSGISGRDSLARSLANEPYRRKNIAAATDAWLGDNQDKRNSDEYGYALTLATQAAVVNNDGYDRVNELYEKMIDSRMGAGVADDPVCTFINAYIMAEDNGEDGREKLRRLGWMK